MFVAKASSYFLHPLLLPRRSPRPSPPAAPSPPPTRSHRAPAAMASLGSLACSALLQRSVARALHRHPVSRAGAGSPRGCYACWFAPQHYPPKVFGAPRASALQPAAAADADARGSGSPSSRGYHHARRSTPHAAPRNFHYPLRTGQYVLRSRAPHPLPAPLPHPLPSRLPFPRAPAAPAAAASAADQPAGDQHAHEYDAAALLDKTGAFLRLLKTAL